eukprot:1221103-Alexandrium_andersonii.AAC.1
MPCSTPLLQTSQHALGATSSAMLMLSQAFSEWRRTHKSLKSRHGLGASRQPRPDATSGVVACVSTQPRRPNPQR